MISVREAVEIILAQVKPLSHESVSIADALGRVLAEPVSAPRDIPPRDNSAMDGYAFAHPGSSAPGFLLAVVDAIAAGHVGKRALSPGEASKIMTGAPMPVGADTVVPVEEVERDCDTVTLKTMPARGANVRKAGEDVKTGQVVLEPGARIRPAEISMLASLARSFIKVHARPRVAILATGDEIAEIDAPNVGDMIVNSNSHGLAAQVAEAGGIPVILGIGRDDPDALLAMMESAGNCDFIVTSGGVSMGDYDFVPEVFERFGAKLLIQKVMMKPGKPVVFGVRGNTRVFGLPGNPVSAMVCFEQFVRPALRKLSGCQRLFRPVVAATLEEAAGVVKGKGDRTEFIRCRVERKGGGFSVVSVKTRSSGMISTLVSANGLLVMEVGRKDAKPGDTVPVQLYDYEFLEGEETGW